MHLSVEVVRQATVVVKSAEVRTADVADLEFLMSRRTRRVGERFELLLTVGFGLRGLADAEQLVLGTGDFAHGTEDFDFEEAVVNGGCEIGDAFELGKLGFLQ
jgi:hypothetical protein